MSPNPRLYTMVILCVVSTYVINPIWLQLLVYFFKILFISFYRGEEREKERERNINVWLPLSQPSTGDLTHNPGMYPDWELNWWPFGSQAGTQLTEPHQPGLIITLKTHYNKETMKKNAKKEAICIYQETNFLQDFL